MVSYKSKFSGIFDFFVFFGPTPEMVAQQYAEVVAPTFLPPMWSLGFHLCRYGYNTSEVTQDFVNRMREAGIPQVILVLFKKRF